MSEPLSYRTAGVDVDAGNELVRRLKPIAQKTQREGVLGGLGGFAGCFALSQFRHYHDPVLVSSTDGVGTKLRLAIDLNSHHTVGIDLVAMCVNDLIVMGAEPLFFLDYFATGQLEVAVAESVIQGIATGCQQANVALIGGETAEMPGMYAQKDYDLAGFTVGIAEKAALLDSRDIVPGDVLIALASSGPHSNGYSLIRHIIDTQQISLDTPIGQQTLAEALLTPTRIYVKPLLALTKERLLKGAAHITGGGFIENIPRILPQDCAAWIDTTSWSSPPIFEWLKQAGSLSFQEMHRTFNCGVGMVLCVSASVVPQVLALLATFNEKAWVLGNVIKREASQAAVVFAREED